MVTLYINPDCPFCKNTMRVVQELAISLVTKDVHDAGVAEELIALGGKRQLPYMVDDEAKVSMYESDDIIAYLHQKYGEKV